MKTIVIEPLQALRLRGASGDIAAAVEAVARRRVMESVGEVTDVLDTPAEVAQRILLDALVQLYAGVEGNPATSASGKPLDEVVEVELRGNKTPTLLRARVEVTLIENNTGELISAARAAAAATTPPADPSSN